MSTHYGSTREELDKERLKSAELESKTQNLRAMLIPTQEIQLSDSEVVSKFVCLRSQILRFVKRTWCCDKFKPGFEFTKEHERFLQPFVNGRVDMKYLDNRLRGRIFAHLHHAIFGVRTYALGGTHDGLDAALGKLETEMWNQVPEGSSIFS